MNPFELKWKALCKFADENAPDADALMKIFKQLRSQGNEQAMDHKPRHPLNRRTQVQDAAFEDRFPNAKRLRQV